MAAKAARYSQGTRVLPFTINLLSSQFLFVYFQFIFPVVRECPARMRGIENTFLQNMIFRKKFS